MGDFSQRQNYGGLPVPAAEPTPAEGARISHELGMSLEAPRAVLDELAEMFRFQGMDPARIIKRFAELGAGRAWLKDVVYLISLHICRGTKISKIKKSVSPETGEFIGHLKSTT